MPECHNDLLGPGVQPALELADAPLYTGRRGHRCASGEPWHGLILPALSVVPSAAASMLGQWRWQCPASFPRTCTDSLGSSACSNPSSAQLLLPCRLYHHTSGRCPRAGTSCGHRALSTLSGRPTSPAVTSFSAISLRATQSGRARRQKALLHCRASPWRAPDAEGDAPADGQVVRHLPPEVGLAVVATLCQLGTGRAGQQQGLYGACQRRRHPQRVWRQRHLVQPPT